MIWRLWRWFRNLFVAEQESCQCGHLRCFHIQARYACYDHTADGRCRCQYYVRSRDDDGGRWRGDPDKAPTPNPMELERMVR